jgi:hypothetical protein
MHLGFVLDPFLEGDGRPTNPGCPFLSSSIKNEMELSAHRLLLTTELLAIVSFFLKGKVFHSL